MQGSARVGDDVAVAGSVTIVGERKLVARIEAPSVPAAFGALAFAGPLPIGASPVLAVSCTTLHPHVLADG